MSVVAYCDLYACQDKNCFLCHVLLILLWLRILGHAVLYRLQEMQQLLKLEALVVIIHRCTSTTPLLKYV
jgi:hypothetical protein